jgi:hypothetical protein
MKRAAVLAVAIIGIGIVAGTAAVLGIRAGAKPGAVTTYAAFAGAAAPTPGATAAAPSPAAPVWTEVKWPFLLDQWGVGKAYECRPADCGVKIEVYIRPKIGFCNCATGVSDDAELERVADTDLVSPKALPLGPGRPVKVGWMHGLVRPYRVTDEDEKARGRLLSIAFNDECDAVAAVAMVGGGDPAAVEPAVAAFLNTRPMVLWVKKELGLEFVRRDW